VARILIYTNHFLPENFKVNEIAETFNDGINEIRVITCVPNYPAGKIYPGYGYFKKSREVIGKMTICRLPMVPRGSGSKFRLILNYLSYFLSVKLYTFYLLLFKKRYDVVFVHHTSPLLIAIPPVIYKWFSRRSKLVLWDLDIWPDTLKAVGVMSNEKVLGFVKMIYNNYDHILVGSESFVDIVKQRVKNVPVSYFPNWAEDVFTQRTMVAPEPQPTFPEGLKIMFAGNIGAAQDIQTVFEAALILKDEKINWLIVGDGRMKKWLEDEVKKHKMENRFHFYGNNPLKFMPWFFSQADVMLVSLKDEEIFRKTVPAKLQAYMAFKKPILGMLSGEGAKIIKDANCGWVSDSGNVMALAANAKLILSLTPQQLSEAANNGKKYFDEHFRKELRFEQLKGMFGG
jgi:glycosyltransferase involved in cell wall biosynthesis